MWHLVHVNKDEFTILYISISNRYGHPSHLIPLTTTSLSTSTTYIYAHLVTHQIAFAQARTCWCAPLSHCIAWRVPQSSSLPPSVPCHPPARSHASAPAAGRWRRWPRCPKPRLVAAPRSPRCGPGADKSGAPAAKRNRRSSLVKLAMGHVEKVTWWRLNMKVRRKTYSTIACSKIFENYFFTLFK